MGCNCNKKSTLGLSKFGTCPYCMYMTVTGFVCSWVFVIPFLFFDVPKNAIWFVSIPAWLFTLWLLFHGAGYIYAKRKNAPAKK